MDYMFERETTTKNLFSKGLILSEILSYASLRDIILSFQYVSHNFREHLEMVALQIVSTSFIYYTKPSHLSGLSTLSIILKPKAFIIGGTQESRRFDCLNLSKGIWRRRAELCIKRVQEVGLV